MSMSYMLERDKQFHSPQGPLMEENKFFVTEVPFRTEKKSIVSLTSLLQKAICSVESAS